MATGLAFEMGDPPNIIDDAEGFPYVVYYRLFNHGRWLPFKTKHQSPSIIQCARRAWMIAERCATIPGATVRIESAPRSSDRSSHEHAQHIRP